MCALNNKSPKLFERYWESQECSESWEVFCLRKCWWHLQCTAQSMIHHDAADIGSTLRSQLWRHRSPTKSRHKLRPCMHACMCCHRLLLRSLGSNVNGERARAGGKRQQFVSPTNRKKHGLPNIYIAPPLLGLSATLALTTSGASWYDMTAPDP